MPVGVMRFDYLARISLNNLRPLLSLFSADWRLTWVRLTRGSIPGTGASWSTSPAGKRIRRDRCNQPHAPRSNDWNGIPCYVLELEVFPRTEWTANTDTLVDEAGYLLTGLDLIVDGKLPAVWPLERQPYYVETSVPGAFAVGDIRHGSVRRVASAVGKARWRLRLHTNTSVRGERETLPNCFRIEFPLRIHRKNVRR
jgi:hypothetical protein